MIVELPQRSSLSRKRVPSTAAAAPRSSAARTPSASTIPPAAKTGMATVDGNSGYVAVSALDRRGQGIGESRPERL